MPERHLGPYILKEVVGRGGMGTVYRAVHRETGNVCAVKALAPSYAEDGHFRTRFESEIKALIKLDHPNIVRLISYGQDEGNLFFAMELVDGKSLFQMQRSGHRFDWREILKIAKDVGKGLRHAHDRGVIHRDLKPGNLLRSNTGQYKITDFGIAKNFGASQITGENVLGTMDFMSPEQAKGQPVTARSDLYSLGTVLFTLLSGKPPFKSNSVEESFRNLTQAPPPHVSMVAPDVPDEIDDLIRQLMDKNPENRVPTAQALLIKINEIEQQLKDHSEAKTEQKPILSEDTFVEQRRDSSVSTTEQDSNKPHEKTVAPQTVRHTTLDGAIKEPTSKSADYFNTVTAQQRTGQFTDKPAEIGKSGRGMVPLFIGLIAVVLIAGYGVIRAFSAPPADDLYQQISQSRQSPDLVRTQIAQFINAYPDDDRLKEIQQLDRIANAISLYKNLSIRSRMANNRLSEIERQFLDIVNVADNDPITAFSRMNAFLTLSGDASDLSQSDQKCLTAARNYLAKIENDARHKVEFNRTKITMALDRAGQQTDPQESEKIYRSVIELYQNCDWADDLVQTARERLEQRQQ